MANADKDTQQCCDSLSTAGRVCLSEQTSLSGTMAHGALSSSNLVLVSMSWDCVSSGGRVHNVDSTSALMGLLPPSRRDVVGLLPSGREGVGIDWRRWWARGGGRWCGPPCRRRSAQSAGCACTRWRRTLTPSSAYSTWWPPKGDPPPPPGQWPCRARLSTC
jgi:hypothetical protein